MRQGEIHKFVCKVHYKDLDMYSVMYHPKYFELLDSARNQAFEDFGYPIEEQCQDKVGFTVAGIDDVVFKRPLFMGEICTVYTEVASISARSCKVLHWIKLGDLLEEELDSELKMKNLIFKATYNLVFVSIEDVIEFPLNAENVSRMKSIEFNPKVKSHLHFSC
jgi:YbgC/YbaW family acyl-CoA thioester hydrolase